MTIFDYKNLSPMEIVWGLVTVIAFLAALFATYRDGLHKSYPLFIIMFIAFMMFVLRRKIQSQTKGKNTPN